MILTTDDLWHRCTVGFLDGLSHVLIKIFICVCVLQYVSYVIQGSAPLFQFHNAEDLHIGTLLLADDCARVQFAQDLLGAARMQLCLAELQH